MIRDKVHTDAAKEVQLNGADGKAREKGRGGGGHALGGGGLTKGGGAEGRESSSKNLLKSAFDVLAGGEGEEAWWQTGVDARDKEVMPIFFLKKKSICCGRRGVIADVWVRVIKK